MVTQRRRWSELDRDDVFAFMRLRHEVYVMEQKLFEEEYDDYDRAPDTEHWWLSDDSGMCSYLRIVCAVEPRKLGRVVTRADRRGRGLASRLIREVMAAHPGKIVLSAQAQLEGWYEALGFSRVGDNYTESGIPHCRMERTA